MNIFVWIWVFTALFNLWLVWRARDNYESDYYYNLALVFGIILGPIFTFIVIVWGYCRYRKKSF